MFHIASPGRDIWKINLSILSLIVKIRFCLRNLPHISADIFVLECRHLESLSFEDRYKTIFSSVSWTLFCQNHIIRVKKFEDHIPLDFDGRIFPMHDFLSCT